MAEDVELCERCGNPIFRCPSCDAFHHEPWVEDDDTEAHILDLVKCSGQGGPFLSRDRWEELYGKRAVDGG